jgi:hypothetical protein
VKANKSLKMRKTTHFQTIVFPIVHLEHEFKYLGIIFTYNGKLKYAAEQLAAHARKAYYAMTGKNFPVYLQVPFFNTNCSCGYKESNNKHIHVYEIIFFILHIIKIVHSTTIFSYCTFFSFLASVTITGDRAANVDLCVAAYGL